MRNFSKDRSIGKDKEFKKVILLKGETWILADNFLYREEGYIKRHSQDVFILTRDESLINYNLIDNKFDILNFDSFNSYINCCKKVHIVKFNRE